MRWAQRGRPARSLLLAIAIQPLSVGTTAIATLAQFSKDFSFSIKAQTRSVLEILILAMLPTLKLAENKANRVGRIVWRLPVNRLASRRCIIRPVFKVQFPNFDVLRRATWLRSFRDM